MADKKFLTNIQLIGSTVKDETGNQISLTSEERLAVVNALGGPATSTNPLVTKTKLETDLNGLKAGVRWRDPVKYVGFRYDVLATAPVTPAEGDKYVSNVDGKLYTYTSSTWDSGVAVPIPDNIENHPIRILSPTDNKIYQITAGDIDVGTSPIGIVRFLDLVSNKIFNFDTSVWDAGETPSDNWTVEESDTDQQWTYDGDTPKWICNSAGKIPYATTTISGKVVFATDGETASDKAVQGNDSRLLKGHYSTTLSTPTGTTTITHNLGSDKVIVQAWSDGATVDISVAKSAVDPTNKLDVIVNGTPTSVDIYVIALP
jgi:hypothetical protein